MSLKIKHTDLTENNMLYEKMAYFWFSGCEEISSSGVARIIEHFGSAYNAYVAGSDDINHFLENAGLKRKKFKKTSMEELYSEYIRLKEKGILFYSFTDREYPKRLKYIYDPPMWLYVLGKLPEEGVPAVAVIGARNCSAYGRELSERISHILSDAGVYIISGMAAGVDGYAHMGAMMGRMPTFAVLGSGVDVCYPISNYRIYEKLAINGGVISEYPPGSRGVPFHFPMRNRIISGLSDSLIVVEAKDRSGTFITVERALEQGKDIFAVPGRIGDELSEGCNRLIRSGAGIVLDTEDVLSELRQKYSDYFKKYISQYETLKNQKYSVYYGKNGSDMGKPESKKNNKALETEEKMVYARLSLVPKHIEVILAETALEPAKLMQVLCVLELKGIIKQAHANYYVRSIN